ncbi:MAG: fibrobacter succinogenes major paralogous domain-containing protein [Alistipes sp.]|nr:fibrobacter succinogenes major paralogous domain-containing protein [Alistipes sp.]
MLYVPASGFRDCTTGSLSNVGSIGDYWSSAPYAAGHANGGVLYTNSDNVGPLNGFVRAYGFPVRCVQHLQGCLF